MEMINIPFDSFLVEWVESGCKQVFFSLFIGDKASLHGGIVKDIDNDGLTIITVREMFAYFLKHGYITIYSSNNNDMIIYELTDKGFQRANYIRQFRLK